MDEESHVDEKSDKGNRHSILKRDQSRFSVKNSAEFEHKNPQQKEFAQEPQHPKQRTGS